MRIITPFFHGILDYVLIIFLLASPAIFGMTGILATFTYGLGIVHLLLTILTAFPLGLIKVIPFRIHGIIEVVVSIFLALMAFWFYNQGNVLGFYFYMVMAIIIMIVFILTNFRGSPVNRPS
ncbi:MAG: hypothetical protein ABIT96_01195 [Ferruginibacter sp.]